VNFEEPPDERETDFSLTIKNWQDRACGPCVGGSENKKYKTLHFRAGTVEDKKLWIDHFKRISLLPRLKDKARTVPDASSDTSSSTCVSSIDDKPSKFDNFFDSSKCPTKPQEFLGRRLDVEGYGVGTAVGIYKKRGRSTLIKMRFDNGFIDMVKLDRKGTGSGNRYLLLDI
jgi:hypothetical protein